MTSETLQVSQQFFKKDYQNMRRKYTSLRRTLNTIIEILEDRVFIRGIKKENKEKTRNSTSHMHSSSLCGLFRWNPNQFLSDTERAHRGDYKNSNLAIYVKCFSRKVFQAVLDSIRANISRQINSSASRRYSGKVQKRMNRLLTNKRELKNDEEKSSWRLWAMCTS